ncbi:protein D1-like isoform X1 [Homalodisca vitripennis]|uniref:protein D1-like isoform X1 n=1 Tax=Homalodisca vitripennis TaxID=197043 RepID=UPI001EEA5C54|nr:protein D1-like isoform X1 [Homalodisca vitripennis]
MVRLTVALVCALCPLLAVHGADPGCSVDDKTFQVGEQYDVPGHCSYNVCKGDNVWTQAACGAIGIPNRWGHIPEDPTKPFPKCCGRAVPPHSIVPDLLDDLQWSDILEISYDSGVKADLGNELTPTQVKNQPQVNYTAKPTDLYMLAMVDPDAPSRTDPKFRSFKHWLVGNIQGSDISTGEVLAEYVGSGPPQGTGLHRYVFLLFKQPGKLEFDEPRVPKTSADNRRSFSIQDFAKKYKLGSPVAINLYQAQYDDYVPVVHAQLGFKAD